MRGKTKLIGIAAISLLVTAVTALAAFGPAPGAQAQSSGRSVTDVSLGHNDSHHLTINWEEPELNPKDSRVMWAKASETYKTWTDSSGNAFPTDTSHAVSDVQRGRGIQGQGQGPLRRQLRALEQRGNPHRPRRPPGE